MKKILLKNSNIINNDATVDKNKDIYIENSRIVKIIDTNNFNLCCENVDNNDSCEIIDCSTYYVSPGLVNLHSHAAMNIFKGIAEDVTIDDWFNKEIFPYESKLQPEDIYNGVKLAILEMLNNGVTAFADHYFGQESVLKAAMDSKIRIDLASTIFGLAPNYKEQLQNAKEFISKNRNISSRVNLRLGPHAPYTCPGEILSEIVNTAKELNVGIHLHVSETKEQVDTSLDQTKKTPFEVLYESGGFDINTIVAHGLWVEENDIKYLNDKTYFAFCPKTYMKLAMGEGNIYKYHDRINYSFGTDGGASSNTLNPLEQARLFALNGKFINNDSESFKIKDIWKHLMDGHKALAFNTGEIKEGKDADIIIWDLNRPNTFPIYNPVISILYSSNSENVLYTMIEGEFIKYKGKLTLDEKEVLNNISNVQSSILERGKGKSNVNY
ncbi:amidohydrolase family protein [Sedimentibacter sp. zth1]|uniref:amidohydrolase family protein n=1 Tax=Sedimentibacter sp. zth1 TaxID=2816908 RepID=UPI001A92E391|nr:amidohydrolase family protein [Sedimentibacter sp. zth1]QSX04705.1 amidohydrolase family protein [Sedimentibacter sp. zth1]